MENFPTIVETIQKEYDSSNQLIEVTERDGGASGTIEYTQENTYNEDGQRISKTDNGETTYYYYQDGVLLYTTDSNGNKTSQNIVGPDKNIIATLRYEEDGQSAYLYNKDIRTSVTNVVDNTGEGVVSYKYDNYGTTLVYGDTDFYNEICYTSGVYDELTSLYYLNARYYNPSDAVFITQDSYRGEKSDYSTWNMYAYCGGNPITYIDPSGHNAGTAVLYTYGAANIWNPSGWIAIVGGTVLLVGSAVIMYEAGKAYSCYITNVSSDRTKVKVKVKAKVETDTIVRAKAKLQSSTRCKSRIGLRRRYNTRKREYDAAKKAGKGKEPINHNGPNENPHFHPNINSYKKELSYLKITLLLYIGVIYSKMNGKNN